MSLILDAMFSSVALSHFVVDLLNGQRGVLFTYLSGPLGLTNTTLGLVTTAYILSAALMQPVFGYLTDRVGPRWMVAGGVLWMGALFTLGVAIPGRPGLLLLVLASIGSGAFHPAGTMQATLRSRRLIAGRETTATSYFFLFGQLGFFVGPLLGGLLLDQFGQAGLIGLTVLTLPIGFNAALQLTNARSENIRPVVIGGSPVLEEAGPWSQQGTVSTKPMIDWSLLLILALLATVSSWALQTLITFIPKHLSDLGLAATGYGMLASLYVGGSAFGNVIGGTLADRFGKRRVAAVGLGLASLPLLTIPRAGISAWLFLLIPFAGLLMGSAHSIVVVLAQRIIPTGMGLASGLILGFMFTTGALGLFLSGILADRLGVPVVFPLSAGLAVAAAVLALALPRS